MKSSESPEGRRNLQPIETLLNCCGATIETKHTYIDEHLCPGTLSYAVCERICTIFYCIPLVHSQEDCFTVLSTKIDTMGTAILVCGILLLIVQFFTILFSNVLCRAFQERGPAYYAWLEKVWHRKLSKSLKKINTIEYDALCLARIILLSLSSICVPPLINWIYI